MSREKIDNETAARIEEQLPNVNDLRTQALGFRPETICLSFPAKSTIPIAAVCLQDVTSTLQEVRYALMEVFAHLICYREKAKPSNEPLAVFFGRFFIDDAALRLYAAGEHLAEAIIAMLEIAKEDLNPFRKGGGESVGSTQRLVGKFLLKTKPDHEISKAIQQLIDTEEWSTTINYRNAWVHSKPPIVKGLGVQYERRNRLVVTDTYVGVNVGGGDEPEYSIDKLLGYVLPATFAFVKTTDVVIGCYDGLLKAIPEQRF